MTNFRTHQKQPDAPCAEAAQVAALLKRHEYHTALLVIDVQEMFCAPRAVAGNAETASCARRIAAATPFFRASSVPVYAVRTVMPTNRGTGFYEFAPAYEDRIVSKTADSGFDSGNLGMVLAQDRRELLLISGVSLNRAVLKNALDAIHAGFDVIVLRDLTANDILSCITHHDVTRAIECLKRAGAVVTTLATVTEQLGRVASEAPVTVWQEAAATTA